MFEEETYDLLIHLMIFTVYVYGKITRLYIYIYIYIYLEWEILPEERRDVVVKTSNFQLGEPLFE